MASDPATPSRVRVRGWLASAVPVTLGALLAGPFCFNAITEIDAGWHLALGRLIARDGLVFTNALTWTFPDFPWYPTSWLFDWLAFALAEGLGLLGLQVLCFALLLATLALMVPGLHRLHPQGPWLVPAMALLLLPRLSERPFLASWALLAAIMSIGLTTRGGPARGRAWAVPLIAIASNFHSGAVFGAILLALFCVDAFLERRGRGEAVVAVLGFAALLANPGGLFNLWYVVEHLGVQEVVRMGEFNRPSLDRTFVFFPLVVLAPLLALLDRDRRRVLLAACLVFAGLGFFARRMVYDFYIVAVFCLAAGLRPVSARFGAAGAAAAALVFAVPPLVDCDLSQRLRVFSFASRFNANRLPVRAAEFVRREGLSGRGYNALRDGGFLEYALPEVPAFQDSRVQAFPPEFFEAQRAAAASPATFQRFLEENDVEWAIASRIPEDYAGFRMLDGPRWALVYWDSASEVFVRRDVSRFAAVVERLEYRYFRPYGSILGAVTAAPVAALPAYAAEVARFLETSPREPLALVVDCALARRSAAVDAGARCERARAAVETEQHRALLEKALALGAAGAPQ